MKMNDAGVSMARFQLGKLLLQPCDPLIISAHSFLKHGGVWMLEEFVAETGKSGASSSGNYPSCGVNTTKAQPFVFSGGWGSEGIFDVEFEELLPGG